MTDSRKARCHCSQIEVWLENTHGIKHTEYIMRDVFSQPKSRQGHIPNFSYTLLDMHDEENIVALKTFYPEYRRGI